jgi:predicted transcriptional regulator
MSDVGDAIISIRPHFAEAILSGAKTVELRRRIPSIEIGTRLWIYATRPTGAVIGSAILEKIVTQSPSELWASCGDKAAVDRITFDNYFDGVSVALGLFLSNVCRSAPVDISRLRQMRQGFHPPQVIARLSMAESCSLGEMIGEGAR